MPGVKHGLPRIGELLIRIEDYYGSLLPCNNSKRIGSGGIIKVYNKSILRALQTMIWVSCNQRSLSGAQLRNVCSICAVKSHSRALVTVQNEYRIYIYIAQPFYLLKRCTNCLSATLHGFAIACASKQTFAQFKNFLEETLLVTFNCVPHDMKGSLSMARLWIIASFTYS